MTCFDIKLKIITTPVDAELKGHNLTLAFILCASSHLIYILVLCVRINEIILHSSTTTVIIGTMPFRFTLIALPIRIYY